MMKSPMTFGSGCGTKISMLDVVEAILSGGVVVYPTETLYAIGCDATNPAASRRIAEIKARPSNKPLPILVGSMSMLEKAALNVSDEVVRLAEMFWPGPLSVLIESQEHLAPEVRDEQGFTSMRWTPHPLATRLCRELGAPLVATSANISGRPAVARPDDLDPELLDLVDESMLERPWPGGGDPSTLVRPLGGGRLAVLRLGAISMQDLQEKGFTVT